MKKIVVLLTLFLVFACSSCAKEPNLWLEDYDYFWTTVEENYPLYAAAERITGRDLGNVKQEYRPQAETLKDAQGLYDLLTLCVQEFGGTGHFQLFDEAWYRDVMNLFRDTTDPKSRYEYDLMNQPAARMFYGYSEVASEGNHAVEPPRGNLIFKSFPAYGTAYVEILSMNMSNFEEERRELEDFFVRIEGEGYRHCIIDIRRNRGGDSSYGVAAVVAPNISGGLSSTRYALVRGGAAALDYFKTVEDWLPLRPIKELPVENLPALEEGDLALATHFFELITSVDGGPEGEPPLFSGQFWLLVGPRVYSASEAFAAFCKDTGFASLVGEPTGGDGIGINPYMFHLPNSGICVEFSTENGLNVDGSCNEEYGTTPDIPSAPGMDALQTCLAAISAENGGK